MEELSIAIAIFLQEEITTAFKFSLCLAFIGKISSTISAPVIEHDLKHNSHSAAYSWSYVVTANLALI